MLPVNKNRNKPKFNKIYFISPPNPEYFLKKINEFLINFKDLKEFQSSKANKFTLGDKTFININIEEDITNEIFNNFCCKLEEILPSAEIKLKIFYKSIKGDKFIYQDDKPKKKKFIFISDDD